MSLPASSTSTVSAQPAAPAVKEELKEAKPKKQLSETQKCARCVSEARRAIASLNVQALKTTQALEGIPAASSLREQLIELDRTLSGEDAYLKKVDVEGVVDVLAVSKRCHSIAGKIAEMKQALAVAKSFQTQAGKRK